MKIDTMKKQSILYHTATLLAAVALLAGCTKSETDDKPEPRMLLAQEEQAIGSQGGPLTVEIDCNVDYEVRLPGNADWLRESTSDTPQNGIHRFEVDPNDEYDKRTARIVFTNAEYGLSQTFTLTQMQKNAILVAEDIIPIGADGGTLDFAVDTNVDFQIETSVSWIRQTDPTRGLTQKMLYFKIDANPDTTPREGEIQLTADGAEQTILITQAPYDGIRRISITHTREEFTIPMLTGSYPFSGSIDWGDGTGEEYSEEAFHTYPKRGTYTVILETEGAEEVTLPDLIEVTEINLSRF